MAELTCPTCGAEAPDTGISGQIGTGDAAGNMNLQPPVQHRTCPGCGTTLVRNPESDVPELAAWRVEPGVQGE